MYAPPSLFHPHLLLGVGGEAAVGGDGVEEAVDQRLVGRHRAIAGGRRYAVLDQGLDQLGRHRFACLWGGLAG